MTKKSNKKFKKRIPQNKAKHKRKTIKIVVWSIVGVAVVACVAPEVVIRIYNHVKQGDSTEIKLPQKSDLFPEDENQEDKKNEEILNNKNKNYAYEFLKDMIRPQIEEKLGFELAGDFDVLGVFEINQRSDAFSSKDTRLKILIKPKNGKIFCVDYNNNNCDIEIEKQGTQSDIVSSFVSHLQNSSIQSVEINDEFFEDLMQNLSEQNIVFVGKTQTYIEKNGEKSYSIPVFFDDGEKIVVKTFKGLQSEIEKNDKTPEEELANLLYGDKSIMREYSNSNQQDLSQLNSIIKSIRQGDVLQETEDRNKDLFPDDEFADVLDFENQK